MVSGEYCCHKSQSCSWLATLIEECMVERNWVIRVVGARVVFVVVVARVVVVITLSVCVVELYHGVNW